MDPTAVADAAGTVLWLAQAWLGLQAAHWVGGGGLQRLWKLLVPGLREPMRRRCGPRWRRTGCPVLERQGPVPLARPAERPPAVAAPVHRMQLRKRN